MCYVLFVCDKKSCLLVDLLICFNTLANNYTQQDLCFQCSVLKLIICKLCYTFLKLIKRDNS